ncbi:DNA-3-methyladenine glycosylase I [Novosphingobium pentaromativorans US6-1]|uniref:DNA-3-methyladenine glycosylase I n=1 Tax=Novosphingobium pentaromativorans US6-1 TaxID=1088721 RepID=G6EHB2_9SPHN|nr:DNA-3-methyladenine glycosylase I [Novosphingobium pentaromativorans US6-1]
MMEAYHDAEWGVPVRDPRLLWEMLVLEGFQAGLSWRTILHRRDGFRRAFDGFDPEVIAAYGTDKVEALMQDEGIIRARAKIEATIGNARAYLRMREEGRNFAEFIWSFVDGKTQVNDGTIIPASTHTSAALSKALKVEGFKFVGPTIAYAFMQAVGMVDDHEPGCFRRA